MNEQDSKQISIGGRGRDGRMIMGEGENTISDDNKSRTLSYQEGAGRGGNHHQEDTKDNYDGVQDRKEYEDQNAGKKEDEEDVDKRRDRMSLIRILPFPVRLHRMLMDMEQNGTQHIVSWSSCGRMCCVHNQELFVREIIPIYFNMSKYRSFTRQLSNYGFQRIDNQFVSPRPKATFVAYHHPNLIRENPQLSRKIKKTNIENNKKKMKKAGDTDNHGTSSGTNYVDYATRQDSAATSTISSSFLSSMNSSSSSLSVVSTLPTMSGQNTLPFAAAGLRGPDNHLNPLSLRRSTSMGTFSTSTETTSSSLPPFTANGDEDSSCVPRSVIPSHHMAMVSSLLSSGLVSMSTILWLCENGVNLSDLCDIIASYQDNDNSGNQGVVRSNSTNRGSVNGGVPSLFNHCEDIISLFFGSDHRGGDNSNSFGETFRF